LCAKQEEYIYINGTALVQCAYFPRCSLIFLLHGRDQPGTLVYSQLELGTASSLSLAIVFVQISKMSMGMELRACLDTQKEPKIFTY
jgi:hypothetical protein